MTKTCEAAHEMAAHGPCSMKPDHAGSHRNERGEFWTEASPLDDKVANMERLAEMLQVTEGHRLDFLGSDAPSDIVSAEVVLDEAEAFLRDNFSPSDPLWPLLRLAVRGVRRSVDIELRNRR